LTTTGKRDALLIKFNAMLSAPLCSTYIGGADEDLPTGVAIDGAGYAYVSGWTSSPLFPRRAARCSRDSTPRCSRAHRDRRSRR